MKFTVLKGLLLEIRVVFDGEQSPFCGLFVGGLRDSPNGERFDCRGYNADYCTKRPFNISINLVTYLSEFNDKSCKSVAWLITLTLSLCSFLVFSSFPFV